MLKSSSVLPEFTHKVTPFAHQEEVLSLSCHRPYYGLFMEMGTGKSKVMVDTMTKLFLERQIDGVLIIAPKGGYFNWVDEEIPIHMHDWLPKRMACYNADWGKMESRIAYTLLGAKNDCLDILCVNVEALTTEKGFEFAETFTRSHYTMVIVDESTCIKNHTAKRSKAVYKLGKLADYRRILTGTPITNSPLDLFGQCEFLSPGCLGFDNYVAFQAYYAVVRTITQGTRRYDVIDRYRNLPELTAKIQDFSYRKLKEECLDLPEKIWMNHYVEQTKEQKDYYDKMKEEAMIQFGEKELVSSTSVITTMMKLHQINCGHVKDDFGNVHEIPNNRVPELMGILSRTNDKVIIWCNFINDVMMINNAISKQFKTQACLYYGAMDSDARRASLDRFRNGDGRFFLATLGTAAKALTIIESAYTVYYSYDYNLETWLQSQDRNHRSGQKRNVTYMLMQTTGTVDTRMLKKLKNKEDLASQVLDNWRELLS